MKYYYLIDNKIMSALTKMPPNDPSYKHNEFHIKVWLNSLQPCEISESELDKVKSEYIRLNFNVNNNAFTNPIDITDIIDAEYDGHYENVVIKLKQINTEQYKFEDYENQLHRDCDLGCFYGCSKGGTIHPECVKHPKQVEEIEAVDFAEWILKEDYAKYIDNNGKFLWGKFKETKDYTTKQLHEIFKNQK